MESVDSSNGSTSTTGKRLLPGASPETADKRPRKQDRTNSYVPAGGSNLTLETLPVEILETMCNTLIHPERPWHTDIAQMFSLRLTSHLLRSKTDALFAISAFEILTVPDILHCYRRLQEISKIEAFATRVRIIHFRQSRYTTVRDYRKACRPLEPTALGTAQRRQMLDELFQADCEQNHSAFYENSPMMSLVLVDALSRLSNLQYLNLGSGGTDQYYSTIVRSQGNHTTKWFQTLLTCLHFAGVKPDRFEIHMGSRGFESEGIAMHALAVPSNVLQCFDSLRSLDLRIETKGYQRTSKKNYAPILWARS